MICSRPQCIIPEHIARCLPSVDQATLETVLGYLGHGDASATKKLYRMIQLDLRDAGIPYQTEEGIADFHAAGRHTYITQLIRSGVSLPTAMELARHSDVKMTMRYTRIGIADQAAALASLPAAQQPVTPGSTLHGRCISRGGDCHNGAEDDISDHVSKRKTP